jgi:hypothetical protein
MADMPADKCTTMTAATPTIEATERTNATTDATPDSTEPTPTSQALVQLNAATSAMNLTERKSEPTSATENSNDHATIAGKTWPRLHLLGLPRELRDEIWRLVVIKDSVFYIGVSFGRQGSFSTIPTLIRVSRQTRHETRRMFLEENIFALSEREFLTCLSPNPLIALRALCAGAELQKIEIGGDSWRGSEGMIRYRCQVSKTQDGLKVEFEKLYNKEGESEPCGCRVENWASLYGQQDNAIIRLLEALREDYLNVAYNKCDWNDVHDEQEHYGCTFGQHVDWCDVHPGSILC